MNGATIRWTHHGAAGGERRVSHLETQGTHPTVGQVRDFLSVAPDDAPVVVMYETADQLGRIGTATISVEWTQENR